MIEIVYNEKVKSTTEQEAHIKLPKNIRQIGQIDDAKKVYMEDYVVTYVHQLTDYYASLQQVGILLGHTYEIEGKKYIFINGAIQLDDITRDEGFRFNDMTWSNIYEKIKRYFDSSEIVGWFISRPDFDGFDWKEVTKTHLDHFAGNDKVFAKVATLEKEIRILAYDNGVMDSIQGYYIYYEKNQDMQNYMIDEFQLKETVKEEKIETVDDKATRHFREIIQEKKDNNEQSKLMVFMYTSSIVLIMVVFVIGITLLNNYDRMKNMEHTLSSITNVIGGDKAASAEPKIQSDEAQQADTNSDTDKIPVESAQSGVSLQEEVAKENEAAVGATQANGVPQTDASTPTTTDQVPPPTENTTGTEQTTAPQIANTPTVPEQTQEIPDTSAQQAVAKPESPKTYVIQQGDTLLSISRKIYNSDTMIDDICNLNNITNSDQIKYGQTILLP